MANRQKDKKTKRQTEKQKNRKTDKQTNRQIDKQVKVTFWAKRVEVKGIKVEKNDDPCH